MQQGGGALNPVAHLANARDLPLHACIPPGSRAGHSGVSRGVPVGHVPYCHQHGARGEMSQCSQRCSDAPSVAALTEQGAPKSCP